MCCRSSHLIVILLDYLCTPHWIGRMGKTSRVDAQQHLSLLRRPSPFAQLGIMLSPCPLGERLGRSSPLRRLVLQLFLLGKRCKRRHRDGTGRNETRTGAVTKNCAVASIPLPPVPVDLSTYGGWWVHGMYLNDQPYQGTDAIIKC